MSIKGWDDISTKVCWAAIFIWFGANLLSQAVYLGFNGVPYDANQMLLSLGNWYWGFVIIELFVWIIFGSMIVKKFKIKPLDEPVIESA